MRGLAQDLLQLLKLRLHFLRTLRLQVQSQQRLGVALSHVEPPVAVVDRDAVEVIDLALLVGVAELADLAVLVFDLEVDLAALAVLVVLADELRQRLLLCRQDRDDARERDRRRVGVVVVAEVDVAGQLAAS